MTEHFPERLPEQQPETILPPPPNNGQMLPLDPLNDDFPPPPPLSGTVMSSEDIYDVPAPRRGCSGCAWGVAGALGCLGLLILPIIVLLLAGTISVNSIIGNFRDIFTKPAVITAQTVLERVQGMSNLTVVRYNYSSLVTSEREMPGILAALYGERQVMVAVGQINAGIDLSQITADDVTTDGNTVIVKLPPPVLQECFLNDNASYIVSRDTGIFASEAPNLDTEARRFAVRQFRDSAVEAGILDEVQANAREVVGNLVEAVADADTQVQVVAAAPSPQAALPDSCQ